MLRVVEISKPGHYNWTPIIHWINDDDSISTSTNLDFLDIEDAFDWIRKELANEQHYISELNTIATDSKENLNMKINTKKLDELFLEWNGKVVSDTWFSKDEVLDFAEYCLQYIIDNEIKSITKEN